MKPLKYVSNNHGSLEVDFQQIQNEIKWYSAVYSEERLMEDIEDELKRFYYLPMSCENLLHADYLVELKLEELSMRMQISLYSSRKEYWSEIF